MKMEAINNEPQQRSYKKGKRIFSSMILAVQKSKCFVSKTRPKDSSAVTIKAILGQKETVAGVMGELNTKP